MPSLQDLEPEIVALILEFVNDTSPRTTRAVACVDRYFNEITKHIAHRRKVIPVQGIIDDDIVSSIQSWTSDGNVLANIRTLTVTGWIDVESYPEDVRADEDFTGHNENLWDPLVTLLVKIGRLRLFEWNVKHPIPANILNTLEDCQKASTLRIFNFTRATTNTKPTAIELRLAQSPALTHLRTVTAESSSGPSRRPELQEIAFRTIVASAPNLEFASLIRRHYRSEDQEVTDNIKRWKLAFFTHTKPNTSVKQLTLDGMPMSKDILEEWSSIIDLASLQNIKFSRGIPRLDYFRYAGTVLSSLKHLSLNLRNIREAPDGPTKEQMLTAVQTYIANCAPLTTLSLWSWMNIVPLSDLLDRHGSTLETLHLHEREEHDCDRVLLSLEEVQAIRTSCTRLRDFTFDLARHDAKLRWSTDVVNKAYYDELVQFSSLTHLQIYFDIGYDQPPFFIVPYDANADIEDNNSSTSSSDIEGNDDDQDDDSNGNGEPARKRPRRSSTDSSAQSKPGLSRVRHQRHYAVNIWTHVFGHDSRAGSGGRHLGVKFGEWDKYTPLISNSYISAEAAATRFIIVQPHERDDVDVPFVRVLRKEPER